MRELPREKIKPISLQDALRKVEAGNVEEVLGERLSSFGAEENPASIGDILSRRERDVQNAAYNTITKRLENWTGSKQSMTSTIKLLGHLARGGHAASKEFLKKVAEEKEHPGRDAAVSALEGGGMSSFFGGLLGKSGRKRE